MAKSRAQRKAEQRRRRELGLSPEIEAGAPEEDLGTEAPDLDQLPDSPQEPLASPAPSRADVGAPDASEADLAADAADKISRRERRRREKEEQRASQASIERRQPQQRVEKEHGAIVSFFSSVRKELSRVQWPDRDTLVQASAVTLLFVAVAAAYLGALDAVFSRLVDLFIT